MAKRTAIQLDEELLHAATVRAAETGRTEYEVVEAALRNYLGTEGAPTLDGLRQRREELQTIAEAHGARSLPVFGSVARGEARSDSDVDFLVDLDQGRSLLDLSSLILDLQEALRRKVDVVEISTPSRIADRIEHEAVLLRAITSGTSPSVLGSNTACRARGEKRDSHRP